MESDVNVCVTYDPTKFGPFIIGTTSIPEAGIYSVCGAIQNLWLAARAENIGLGWVSLREPLSTECPTGLRAKKCKRPTVTWQRVCGLQAIS